MFEELQKVPMDATYNFLMSVDKDSIDKEIMRLGVEALMFWELPKVKSALNDPCQNGSSMIVELCIKDPLTFHVLLLLSYLLTYTIQPQWQSATEKESNIQARKRKCVVSALMM